MMKTTVVLILMWTICVAQKESSRTEWSARYDATERVPPRGCSNLTLVLDNWKFAIQTQVKDLLLHDHNTVLPDYGRIQTLSDALADLYKEFNTLKERLALMTTQFDTVEGFVDNIRSERNPSSSPRAGARPPGVPEVGARPPMRRSRVVIRRVQKPNLR